MCAVVFPKGSPKKTDLIGFVSLYWVAESSQQFLIETFYTSTKRE